MQNIQYKLQPSFTNNYIISSILYVSYNSLGLIPIILAFKNYSLSTKQKYIIGGAIFVVLGVLSILIFRIINMFFPQIMVYELPTLKLAEMLGGFFKVMYSFVILAALFTTACSDGYAFLEMREGKYELKAILLCIISILLSRVGFSNLVNTIFPLFGYLGILQIVIIVYRAIRKE